MKKAGFEIFEGFDKVGIKFPEYSVIVPQTKRSFTVRTMNDSEESNLKGSVLTPEKIPEHLAEVLWSSIVKKPDDIKTYEDFINKTTIRDRDTLVYALHVATYKNIQEYKIPCSNPQCKSENLVKVDLEKSFTANIWDDEGNGDILKFRKTVDLESLDGVSVVLKAPTIADEIMVAKSNTFSTKEELLSQMQSLMIDKIIVKPNATVPNGDSYTERANIYKAFKQIPVHDKKIIVSAYNEAFDKYQFSVVSKIECAKCHSVRELPIDMTSQFFRSLYE